MPKFKFYEYDKAVVGEDGVIFKHDLTSLPAAGSTVEIGTGHIYSEAGFTGAATNGINFNGITDQSDLAIEGTIRFMVDSRAFDGLDISLLVQNFIILTGGTNLTIQSNPAGQTKIVCGVPLDHKKTPGNDMWMYGNSSGWDLNQYGQVEVFITFDSFGVQIYIDRFKVVDLLWLDSATNPLVASLLLNGSGVNGGDYTYRELLIATKKTSLKTSSSALGPINFYGDSYVMQGNYGNCDTSDRASQFYLGPDETVPLVTLDGNSGPTFDSKVDTRDAGMLPQVHRQLNKAGLYTPRVNFWGEGGSGYESVPSGGSSDDVPGRTVISVNGSWQMPHVAVFVAGYNDASGTGPSAGFKTAIETAIASVEAANSSVIIIITTLPFNTNTAYLSGTSDKETKVRSINTSITEVAEANPLVSLIDINALAGGYTADGTLTFRGDFVHPSNYAQAQLYGNYIAAEIIRRVRG